MLRAWDGVEAGASRRQVASVILNPDVASFRALERKNASERRRLARIRKPLGKPSTVGICAGLCSNHDV